MKLISQQEASRKWSTVCQMVMWSMT